MDKTEAQSAIKTFIRSFPWKDVFIGFLIPKGIFLYGMKTQLPFVWAGIAILWCVTVFLIGQVKTHKANIFAVLSLLLILVRIVVVTTQKNPRVYLVLVALDEIIFGLIFAVTLLLKHSAMELLVKATGIQVPDEIRHSGYYSRCWRIVTAVWAAGYLLFALVLVSLKAVSLKIVGRIDMFGWLPLLALLIMFTIWFPPRYWRKHHTEIIAGK